jgi:ABC-type antimicrobial peptide transport system ATPase subunit
MLQEHIKTFPETLDLGGSQYNKAVRTLYYMLKDEVQSTMLGTADGHIITLYRMTGGIIASVFGNGTVATGHICGM